MTRIQRHCDQQYPDQASNEEMRRSKKDSTGNERNGNGTESRKSSNAEEEPSPSKYEKTVKNRARMR